MREMKSLRKLRCKPQDSEVFHCGSLGIDAYRVCPYRDSPKVLPNLAQGSVAI
jgi:hypothetical protein